MKQSKVGLTVPVAGDCLSLSKCFWLIEEQGKTIAIGLPVPETFQSLTIIY